VFCLQFLRVASNQTANGALTVMDVRITKRYLQSATLFTCFDLCLPFDTTYKTEVKIIFQRHVKVCGAWSY